MIKLPGYVISNKIYEGNKNILYRGYMDRDKTPIVCKLIKTEYPNLLDIASLRYEYEIYKKLNITGIPKVYSIETYRNSPVIIMEDIHGESLKARIRGKSIGLQNLLKIFIKLSDILGTIHENGIIHKDINPNNIIINYETEDVKIIDFGNSTQLSIESMKEINISKLEGTLPYISPEQTGRMNRNLDYRTDFYSLGVTLYEAVSGVLPFKAQDDLELIHCHIARNPIPLYAFNTNIPKVVSDIAAKLMEKDAEKRYQSTAAIKKDLSKCLEQLSSKGKIDYFELGENDICEKFRIPQKLYGRKQEITDLMDVYKRVNIGSSEMVLVTGFSGIGKSSLVDEMHKPIVESRGYFTTGKFDQYKRNIPYSAIIQALGGLIRQILCESEEKIARWRERLLNILGHNGQVIIDVIPEVEMIVGKQTVLTDLAPSESQNRFNLMFQNFCGVFCSEEHPLVIFLDDLQWADLPSLKLIQILMTDTVVKSLLIVGAYRDNEVEDSHVLLLTIKEIEEMRSKITKIVLKPLDLVWVNQLICETLNCEKEKSLPLAQLCIRKTDGNPFFLRQFLYNLHKDNLIEFEVSVNTWKWDIDKIEKAGVTENILDMMVYNIHRLPPVTQNVLKLAACIGNVFGLKILSVISEKRPDTVTAELWMAFERELILPLGDNYKFAGIIDEEITYRFLHDRIQQAAYSLIEEFNKKEIHLKIGRLMLENLRANEIEEKLFDIVNHLNLGMELVENIEERKKIAALNLLAGKRAKSSAAFESAYNYFCSGIKLIDESGWDSHYDLMLDLCVSGTEAAYLSLKFEDMDVLVDTVIKHAKTVLEKISVYEIKIQAYMAQNNLKEVENTARYALNMLGVKLPAKISLINVIIGLFKTRILLLGKKVDELADLPVMVEPNKIVAMRIMAIILRAFLFSSFKLALISELKQIELSLRYGNSPASSFSYSCYGVMLSGVFGKFDRGYEFGILTKKLVEKSESKELKARSLSVVLYNLSFWINPLNEMLEPLLEAYKEALTNGDFEFATANVRYYLFTLFYTGKELSILEPEMDTFISVVGRLKQKTSLNYLKILRQMVSNFTTQTDNIINLKGASYDEDEMLTVHVNANDKQAFVVLYVSKYTLCYFFGEYTKAIEYLVKMEDYLDQCIVDFSIIMYHFFNALARLALYKETNKIVQKAYLKKINLSLKKLKKWEKYCPPNLSNKVALVEAELERILGNDSKATEKYIAAIELAKNEGNLKEEALANELAGKFFYSKNMPQIAETYMRNAYYCYLKWGANSKVEVLKKEYPGLFDDRIETSITSTTSISRRNPGEILDMASVLKATQAISGEIVLEKLLRKLVQIVLENAGAQKVIFILKRDNELKIEAFGSIDEEDINIVESNKIEESTDLPITIINYVNRTKESIVLDDAAVSDRFISDPYITGYKPKSVLCAPIINKGEVKGILYLENNSAAGVFTEDRIKILSILSSQLAISMENANLYTHLDELVNERTNELTEALENLKTTQGQLIESEKMAALGQLVAGISHEINTPAGVSITAASFLEQKTKEIRKVYEDGKMKRDDFLEYIDVCSESSRIILSNLLRSSDLIRSFKQVAVDQSNVEKRRFNVKEYIEQILLSLMPKLKLTKHSVKINCDEDLVIVSFPGAIAQVVTNFIMNSLMHAYDEGVEGNMLLDIRKAKDKIVFKYSDDGKGIKKEFLSKIFDPFFTTKRGSGGTGLGLNIVYNIVTQKLDGSIKCISEVGEGTTFIIELPIGDKKMFDEKNLTAL